MGYYMVADSGRDMFSDFEKSSELIKSLPPDLFAELCQQSIQHLQSQSGGVDQAVLFQRFQAAGVGANAENLRKIVNAITCLFSTAAKQKLSSEDLVSSVSGGNKLPKPILQVIRHVWNEEGKRLSEMEGTQDLVSAGQVVDFQWKIGMAVSSDRCRSLNHPYVTLVLKVADNSGQITSKVLEMTIPEFQVCRCQFLYCFVSSVFFVFFVLLDSIIISMLMTPKSTFPPLISLLLCWTVLLPASRLSPTG
uniref:COMM domain-containing protein 6 n=1 Tax=Leptobrachium leishanense TaxID=445787 RepID=A0A8C5LPI5_9ANUR